MGAVLNKKDRWWLRCNLVISMVFQILAFAAFGYFGGK